MTRSILVLLALSLSAPAVAADGAAIYKKYCASCHGASGEGGSGVAVAGKQAAFVKEVVEFHPPPMNKLKLPADDLDAVAKYVAGLPKK
jgi:mono/diheme cytochrome c family protein